MRLFFASEIPEAIRLSIRASAEQIAGQWSANLGVDVQPRCFVRAENLHVTLKFIGEVPQQDVVRICGALERCDLHHRFFLSANRIVCLPERGPIGIVSAGLAGELEQLHDLYRVVELACAELDVPRERRAYKPHVTFARLRPPLSSAWRSEIKAQPLSKSATAAFQVNDLVLYESTLEPTGARYVPLARFPLA
jgi:2'-5' RNA ligase